MVLRIILGIRRGIILGQSIKVDHRCDMSGDGCGHRLVPDPGGCQRIGV